jgi:endonuclease/exonuclease/phosphatase family metal-dependent hydrolase
VDVSLGGAAFRFATTHLEVSQPVQGAQMNELISSVGGTTLPLVMAGDFNANADNSLDPTFATYQAAIDAGFADAWRTARGADPGYTCCQAQNLLNATSSLDQRVDLVLSQGGVGVDDIHLIGDSESDRTPSGLWPRPRRCRRHPGNPDRERSRSGTIDLGDDAPRPRRLKRRWSFADERDA